MLSTGQSIQYLQGQIPTRLHPDPFVPCPSSILKFPVCLTTGPLYSRVLYSFILSGCQYKCQLTVFLIWPSLSSHCPHALSHSAFSYLYMAACLFLKWIFHRALITEGMPPEALFVPAPRTKHGTQVALTILAHGKRL